MPHVTVTVIVTATAVSDGFENLSSLRIACGYPFVVSEERQLPLLLAGFEVGDRQAE